VAARRRSLTAALRPLVWTASATRRSAPNLISLEERGINKLTALRGPGGSYSDVILRLCELETKGEL
jgi:hypothetical protein